MIDKIFVLKTWDTFYRFVNSCHVNWFKFTTTLYSSIIGGLFYETAGVDRMNVFIYAAIVFARYMMFTSENRVLIDGRTFGELFYDVRDELPDITWEEAFRILMKLFAAATTEKLFLTEDEPQTLLENFLSALPETLRLKERKCA